MKSRHLSVIVLLLLLFAVPARALTFTDDAGRTVSVDSPKRVAVLIGSFADIWKLAGGGDAIAAAANDAFTDFDLGLSDDVINLGPTKNVSLEGVLSSEPDFVIASCNTEADLALQDSMEAMGIPIAYFRVSTFEDYLRMLNICTGITGCPDRYTEYGEKVAEQVENARNRCKGCNATVLYVRVSMSGCKVKNSENSVLGEMLRSLNTRNIADSETTLLENLSMEVIMAEDPEYIFIVLQGSDEEALKSVMEDTLTGDPAFASLTAVKNGHVYVMDQHLYNLKPNARWGNAYEQLADILCPEK